MSIPRIRPLISVLLPTYNAMPFLPEAVDSIIAQTVTDWHLVIVDDGSTDETGPYLQQLRERLGSQVTIITFPENRGLIEALNTGLDFCDGLYIARMDADDISLPHRFQKQLLYLLEHPEIDGCGAWIQFFGRDNQIMDVFPADPKEVRDRLFEFTTIPHPTYFFHRRVYEQFQYDTRFPHSEDVEFLFRATERLYFSNVQEVLLLYRTGPHQVCSKHKVLKEKQRKIIESEARKRRGLESQG